MMTDEQIQEELAASRRRIWGETPIEEMDARIERTLARLPMAAFQNEAEAESGDIPVRIAPDPPFGLSIAEHAAAGWWGLEGRLTVNHAASSYGQPVLVIDDRPYSVADAIYSPAMDGRPCGYVLYHPNPGREWRSPAFQRTLDAAIAAGWPLRGEAW